MRGPRRKRDRDGCGGAEAKERALWEQIMAEVEAGLSPNRGSATRSIPGGSWTLCFTIAETLALAIPNSSASSARGRPRARSRRCSSACSSVSLSGIDVFYIISSGPGEPSRETRGPGHAKTPRRTRRTRTPRSREPSPPHARTLARRIARCGASTSCSGTSAPARHDFTKLPLRAQRDEHLVQLFRTSRPSRRMTRRRGQHRELPWSDRARAAPSESCRLLPRGSPS